MSRPIREVRAESHADSTTGSPQALHEKWIEERRARALLEASLAHLERARRVFDATERQRRRQNAMLARAGAVLGSSRAFDETLEGVISLVLPELGDFGFFEVADREGHIRRIARAHDDPRRQALLSQTPLFCAVQDDPALSSLATGRPILHAVIDDDWFERGTVSPESRVALKKLGARSMMSVPLSYDARTLGALTLFYGDSMRYYSLVELEFAEALCRLVAAAVANAWLYRDLKESELRAKSAYAAAREAERRKDEFLAMLGHELRNPLSPILTALEILRMRSGTGLEREHAVIERQVHHLVRLVDDLLDVSRITRGKVELRKRRVACARCIEKGLELAAPLFESREHRVTCRVPETELWLLGDEHRLSQVICNLLTNAAKYTEPGGRIDVSVDAVDGRAQIRVHDTGCGISKEALPHIFELFAQSNQTLDRSQGGLGLGLAIVKSLIELHGGTVRAHSEGVGCGSTFIIEVPLASEQSERLELSSEDAIGGGRRVTTRRRVLIVDDNTDVADLLTDALSRRGYTTQAAYDGPSALALSDAFRPEVAILDIGLPVMDGYELCASLRRRFGGSIRLVALSGYGQPDDRRRSRDAGFREHLVKPVAMERLIDVLEEVSAS